MGWQDDFGYLGAALQQGYVGSRPQNVYSRPYRPLPGSSYDPWNVSKPSAPNWLDFATRQPPAQPLGAAAPAAAPRTPGTVAPAAAPERINVNLGYSGAAAPRTPRDTHGDFLASAGEAIGNVLNVVNPFNAIPWLMERTNVAANALADGTKDIPVLGAVTGLAAHGTDAFVNTVKAASDVIAPVLEALPNWYRDTQLADKAKVYSAILKGEVLDPWSEASLSGNLLPFSSSGAKSAYSDYMLFHKALVDSMDPTVRGALQDRISILLDSIDLPDSVKAGLQRDPGADANKLLDAAPEGRQFSYQGGLSGAVSNLGYPLLFYLAEAKGLGTVAGKARLGSGVTWSGIGDAAAGGARVQAAAAAAIKVASQGTTIAARLQGLALTSGATYLGLSTAADTVARFTGDQGLVDWFDKVNRTAVISDKPSVQLVTSFTVNPFEAVGALKRGVVRLAHGAGDITVGRATGGRMAAYFTHNDLLNEQIARMYRLGSKDEAATFIDAKLGGRGEAFDQVVGLALQTVIQKLPEAERATLAGLDSVERLHVGLQTHGAEVMRLLEKEPDMLANRWYSEFWQDRQMQGPFNADVAGLISRDYRTAEARTYEARQRMGAVMGRADYIPPHGISMARAWLDDVAGKAGDVPISGPRGFQDLQRQLPAISRYRQGLIPAGATSIPRSAIETMLTRAEDEYAGIVKTNPVRAATATDPVLRPNATAFEYANALGTSTDTVKQLSDFKPGAPVDLLRQFLVEKVGTDAAEIAGMTPEEVWSRASEYVDRTTMPWVEMGQRVETARRQMLGVDAELARLRAKPRNARDRTFEDRVAGFEKQKAQLADLVRYATDPPTPFSAFVRDARATGRSASASAHMEEMVFRRAQAMDSLERLDAIEGSPVVQAASKLGNVPWHELVRETPINHVTAWSGGATPMSAAFRRRFAEYLRSAVDGGADRTTRGRMEAQATGLLIETGDQEAWNLFWRHPQAMARMTKAQQRIARAADRGTPIDEFSTGYHAREGMNPTDAFLEDLVTARDDRAEILNGRSEYNLNRTAGMKAPAFAWMEKAMIADPRSPTYDPSFVSIDHPHNISKVKLILERPDELFPGLADVVMNDPIMANAVNNIADESGMTVKALLDDPENAPLLRELLVPPGWEPPAPGLQVLTPLDELIAAGDRPSIETMTEQMRAAQTGPVEPLTAPMSTARRLARSGPTRKSNDWRKSLVALGADFSAAPSEAVVNAVGNRVGLDVLSVISHGIPGREPVTIVGVIRALREIENGNAERMGIGAGLQAEGQRVAGEILKTAREDAKRAGVPAEAFSKGMDPAMMASDDIELARELGKGGYLRYDENDPLGSLQYVFKKPPKAAVVQEWSQVPGLAEEFLSGRFEPYEQRLVTHQVSKMAGYLFGRHSNEGIGSAARVAFVDRLGRLGVEAKDAAVIWNRWREIARDSRGTEVRTRVGNITGQVVREHFPGDSALYADVRNLPNKLLDRHAQEALGLRDGLIGPAINHADYNPAYLEHLRTIDYSTAFREASSPVRQWLKGAAAGEDVKIGKVSIGAAPVPKSMGRAMAGAYGLIAHNQAVTTLYHQFRFALDIRYHAMNYFEAQILYLGRAGLRDGEITTGMFGQSEQYLRRLDEDFANNTGYATSRSRFTMAHKTFLKEQPDAMRSGILDIQKSDPNLMHQALDEIASRDPELADMIAHAGEGKDGYLKALDAWHGKLLATASDAEAAATIDQALAPSLAETPALAEVYGRLAQVNKEAWANVRESFYGNPDRSRAERFLNSYLLFWPVSYQIKATKWLLGVMFDRAGGVRTNAVGGYAITEFAQTHQRLLATDPEYQQWFEKHKTLVFMAQMLMPITPDSLGVSLNPILRDMFFERTKAPWEIGPIYTATLIPKLAQELDADIYPTLGQAPGFDGIYRMLTGRQAPARPGQPAPVAAAPTAPPPDPWAFKPLNTPAEAP